MSSSSRWSGGECGKPFDQHRKNGGEQFRVVHLNLLGTALELCFWLHWQRQKAEQRIQIGLLAQLLQAEPHHAIHKRLQLLRQPGRADVETPVRHDDHHSQVFHLVVELEKAKALSTQPVLEPWLAVHLHLQQHHGLLSRAGLRASGPERPIEPMARRFELGSVKAIEHIARRIRADREHPSSALRQQQGDQIRRAFKQPVEPVIGFQTPPLRTEQPTGTGQPSTSRSQHSTPVLLHGGSVVLLVSRPSACDGWTLVPPDPPGGHRHAEGPTPHPPPQPTPAGPRRERLPHPPPIGRRKARRAAATAARKPPATAPATAAQGSATG